jgi:hypothetical protein
MTEGKYIIFDDGSATVFKMHRDHSWMSGDRQARSAGYFRVTNGQVECYGESRTLGVVASNNDAEIIAPYLKLAGGSPAPGLS